MLGTHDSKLAGHIQYDYMNMPQEVEAHMVTLTSKEDSCSYSILKNKKKLLYNKFIYSRRFQNIWKKVNCIFRIGRIPAVDKEHPEYCFYGNEFVTYSAKSILKKCPKGFTPDIISIHWSAGFISSRVVRDLYRITNAKIVYIFVDEAPLTGGCHYPVECKQYLSDCHNCPALSRGKKLAAIQFQSKKIHLQGLPLYISGTPYDMRLAKRSPLFQDAVVLPNVTLPNIIKTKKETARESLNIGEDKFVVLVGAASITSVRKGFLYSIDALNVASNQIDNLLVLSVGKTDISLKEVMAGVEIKDLGYVDLNKLYLAFCAADCFLSTTIADSGPMMVNYSMALGTPVISFPVGIADDLVVHKKTGYRARMKDSNDLANGLIYIRNLSDIENKEMSDDCVALIKKLSESGSWVEQLINRNDLSISSI